MCMSFGIEYHLEHPLSTYRSFAIIELKGTLAKWAKCLFAIIDTIVLKIKATE